MDIETVRLGFPGDTPKEMQIINDKRAKEKNK